MMNTLSGGSGSRPDSPSLPPEPPISLRRRLLGDQSRLLMTILLLGMASAVISAFRPGRDPWRAAGDVTMFTAALLLSSPDRRIHAVAAGLLVGMLWSLAGMPAAAVAASFLFGTIVDYAQAGANRRLDLLAPVQTREELAPLVRQIVVMKVANALLAAIGLGVAAYRLLAWQAWPLEHVIAALAVGCAVDACVVYRDLRRFAASVVGRQAPVGRR
jgi:hypothetical protein